MAENEMQWQTVDHEVMVEITVTYGDKKLRNAIRIPVTDLIKEPGKRPHMILARHMEDYFYPMAQNFCDKVFSRNPAPLD